MTEEELDRMWADENNWTPGGLYDCAADPRRIVPKRMKAMGWTINAAHSSSFVLLVVVGLLAMVPPLIVVFKSAPTFNNMTAAIALSAIIVCGTCAYYSSKR